MSAPLSLREGAELGSTDWVVLTQAMFDAFEALTLSNDPLHTDPQWVRRHTDHESTIAPGLLSLSLLPHFAAQLRIAPPGHHSLNYGFERIRWPQPVPVNSAVRAHFTVVGQQPLPSGREGTILKLNVRIEIRGHERPALVAEWLGAIVPDHTVRA